MKILKLSIGTMIMRLHAMCAIMVTLGFLGYLYQGVIIGMVLFLTTLMGIKWSHIINIFKPHVKQFDMDLRKQRQHQQRPVHH